MADRARYAWYVAALLCAFAWLAACGETAADSLTVARRALADGLWSVAETNALRAAADESLRPAARLVQLEALARAGRSAELVERVRSWPAPESDGVRYWHAWGLFRERRYDEARPLLAGKFSDQAYAPLAMRLAARLEAAAGARAAADALFRKASESFGTNNVEARVENAVEWARLRRDSGDLPGARAVLAETKAADVPGAAGDMARIMSADLANRASDTNTAYRIWRQLIDGGERTDERAYVLAACAISDALMRVGDKASAIAAASNAVARASQPDLARQSGYRLGFALFGQDATRAEGAKLVSSLLHRYPGEAESRAAHLRFADALLAGGDAAGAEREYAALLQTYPEHALDAHVLSGRGWALLEMGRRTEAVGLFARAAQVATNASDRAVSIFKQGDALLADGRYAEAAEAYSRVPAEGGSNLVERARFQQADALARGGQHDKAIKMFRETMDAGGALAVDAGLRVAALESAAGRLEGGRIETGAIDLYGKLLGKKPLTDAQREEILLGRGRAFYSAYRFAEAEKDFAAVAALRPARAQEMAFLSALCLYGAGRDEEAAAAMRKLQSEAVGKLAAEVVFWLAKYDYGHREFASAKAGFAACATNAFLSAARRIEALGRAARCCAAQSDYAGVVEFATRATTNEVAVRAIAKTTPETPAVAEVFVLQGEALMEQARFSDAVLVLGRAQLMAAPAELLRRAAVLKADCLFAMGADDDRRYMQALDAYRAVLRDESLSPSQRLAVSFKIGRSLEKLRRVEEAVDHYYVHVVMAYCDGVRAKTWFDGDARAFFTRAAFILADYYASRGEGRQAVRVLDYLVKTGVPAAREARRRIEQIERKGGAK